MQTIITIIKYIGVAIAAVFALMGFALFGWLIAIAGAALVYQSSDFREWLITRKGFKHRLSKLPGFDFDKPSSLAAAIGGYGLLLSVFGFFLTAKFDDFNEALFVAGLGLITLFICFGWFVTGWGIKEDHVGSAFNGPSIWASIKGETLVFTLVVIALFSPLAAIAAGVARQNITEEDNTSITLTGEPTAETESNEVAQVETEVPATNEPTGEPTEESTSTAVPTNTPEPKDTPAPQPTNTPQPSPQPTETFAPLQSGGLGITREEWERTHELTDEFSFFDIYGSFWATFFASEDERIDFLQWQQEDPETIEYAENLALTLIPKDSVEIRRYTPDGMPETTVILYKSEWLRETLTDENEGWINSEPGEFIVQYNVYPEYDGETNTIIISLGNNP